jgi:hypothetical protein
VVPVELVPPVWPAPPLLAGVLDVPVPLPVGIPPLVGVVVPVPIPVLDLVGVPVGLGFRPFLLICSPCPGCAAALVCACAPEINIVTEKAVRSILFIEKGFIEGLFFYASKYFFD